MAYKSLESMIRSVISDELAQEASINEAVEQLDEANPTGLKIYHKTKAGKTGSAIVFTARDAQNYHKELKRDGHTATHHALMYGKKEGPKKPVNEELDLSFLDEKKLTPAEMKKREDVAKAIERDNPDMPMDKKMAIATATAKRVAEEPHKMYKGDKVVMAKDMDDHNRLKKQGYTHDNPKTKKIEEEDVEEACWDGYKQEGMKKKGDRMVPNCVPEETNEAVGTAAKYSGRSGFMGGKFKSHDRAMELPRKKLDQYRAKQQAKKSAAHKAQDPSMAKRGYAQNVVDRDKAQKKAAKKGLGHQSISYQQGNSIRRGKLPEANDVNEVRGGADEPDKHIVMQLRKAQDVDGNHPITFRGGKQAKVAKKHIDKILKVHDHPSIKPDHKRKIRVAISKSPQHLATFANRLKEQYTIEEMSLIIEANSINEAKKVSSMQIHKVLANTKNSREGIAALKKAFRVNDMQAKKMLDQVMNEEMDDDGKEVIHTRKADFKLTKVRQPDGRMAYRKVKREIDIEK